MPRIGELAGASTSHKITTWTLQDIRVDFAGAWPAHSPCLIRCLGQTIRVDFTGTDQLSKTNILPNSFVGKVHGDRLEFRSVRCASNGSVKSWAMFTICS